MNLKLISLSMDALQWTCLIVILFWSSVLKGMTVFGVVMIQLVSAICSGIYLVMYNEQQSKRNSQNDQEHV